MVTNSGCIWLLELWEIFVFHILFIIKVKPIKKIDMETWTCWLSEFPSTLRSACVPEIQRVAQSMLFLDGQRCLDVNLILLGLALSS